MKSIILHQHEVTQLSATGEVTVIRVVDKKCQRFENAIPLPEAVETERGLMDFPGMKPGDILFHNGLPIRDGEWQPVSCPFATIGEVRWVRETWHQHYLGGVLGGRPCYKADETCNKNSASVIGWKSSTTMPEWASRFKVECTGIEVKQIDGVWSWITTHKKVG
jgi:hypothetical protein